MKRYVSAKSPAPGAHPRLSGPHGDEERPARPQAPPRQGAEAADGFLAIATAWQSGGAGCARRATLRLAFARSGSSRAKSRDESSSAAARRAGVGPREQVGMPAMPSERFAKSRRMRRRGEFQRVFDLSHRTKARYFTLLMAPNTAGTARLGIVASRKLGDAVRRNRAKRLIREIFRLTSTLPAGPGFDVVVIPRRELFDAALRQPRIGFPQHARAGRRPTAGAGPCRPLTCRSPSAARSGFCAPTRSCLSPMFAGSCRFLPSCSDYAAEAVTRFGVVRGSLLAARRLARCHPLGAHGLDPVPRAAAASLTDKFSWKNGFCSPSSCRSWSCSAIRLCFRRPSRPGSRRPARRPLRPRNRLQGLQGRRSLPAPGGTAQPAPVEAAPLVADAAERDILVENEAVRAVFTTRGAALKSWRLKKYQDGSGKPLELVPNPVPAGTAEPFTLSADDPAVATTLSQALYKPSATEVVVASAPATLTFEYQDASGLSARKDFTFSPDTPYVVTLLATVKQGDRGIVPTIHGGPASAAGWSSRAWGLMPRRHSRSITATVRWNASRRPTSRSTPSWTARSASPASTITTFSPPPWRTTPRHGRRAVVASAVQAARRAGRRDRPGGALRLVVAALSDRAAERAVLPRAQGLRRARVASIAIWSARSTSASSPGWSCRCCAR